LGADVLALGDYFKKIVDYCAEADSL